VTFLAIHPFQDGNGRLSRILTTLMLLRAGYHYVPYTSLESIIEENKQVYYRALRRTQKTLKTDAPDWEPWLSFFLRCLKQQTTHLMAKLQPEAVLLPEDLSALSVQVLALLKHHERLTMRQMVEQTGANPNTLKVRLRELVARGLVQRHGKARATWYRAI
jgi:Fic family protein